MIKATFVLYPSQEALKASENELGANKSFYGEKEVTLETILPVGTRVWLTGGAEHYNPDAVVESISFHEETGSHTGRHTFMLIGNSTVSAVNKILDSERWTKRPY